MKKVLNIIKCLIFLAILGLSLYKINTVLEPKYIMKNNTWPVTSSYHQFYEMEPDSIDVLFLGSSVASNAFIPQEIYNCYGITSYNLSSDQQSIFLSYYWLKEALRSQSPKAVVLDTKFMWYMHPDDPINASEGLTRKCIDPMKWSTVKMEAVHTICDLDPGQSELSYYLTNIRFHSRWTELKEYDMKHSEYDHSELKGFSPIETNGPDSYTPFEPSDPTEFMEFVPLMQEYLDKTVELCKQNGISLILVSLPGNEMTDGTHNSYTRYAADNGIAFYNLGSKEYYDQVGAVLPEENVIGHQNIWGAIKTSRFIGKILQDEYGIKRHTSAQYEDTAGFYEHIKKDAALSRITDPLEYLKELKNIDDAIFFAAQGYSSPTLSSDWIQDALKDLGLECKFNESPDNAYIAAIIGKKREAEEISEEKLTYTGGFRDRHSVYIIQSSGILTTPGSSIKIDGMEYSKEVDGLNIVVYDVDTEKKVDRITIRGSEIVR